MYRLGNTDEKEWSLNETSILSPIIDGSLPKEPHRKVGNVNFIPRSENSNTSTSNVERSLVIGLNENLLEPHNTKTDLLIIQDTGLKLISCNSNLKDQFGYTLSYVSQNRSETIWENTELRDKPKEWAQENPIFEVKDIIVYDKENEDLNLHELESDSHDKIEKHVQSEEIVEDESNNGNYQVIINYIPECYSVPPKKETSDHEVPSDNIRGGADNMFRDLVNKVKALDNQNGQCDRPRSKAAKVKQNNENLMLEKNLPLKKKSKMKKTMILFNKQRSLLKQDLINDSHKVEDSFLESKKHGLQSSNKQDCNNSVPDGFNSMNKRRKPKKKAKKTKEGSPILGMTLEQSVELKKESTKADMSGFDIRKFKDIYELVEGLRKYRMISVAVWQILNTGLEEMNVNILEEIVKKSGDSKVGNYSPQLKAFALILYFKQPVAFNFLAKVCNNGWPPLNVIKEWKQQLNNFQRPNFVGMKKNFEEDDAV